jgi:hypothetical protein
LKFPATQVPSANANTLDDYEEGTWTPALSAASGSGVTYTAAVGRYTKIGRVVFVTGRIVVNAFGTESGDLTITGLPFTRAADTGFSNPVVSFASSASLALAAAGQSLTGKVDANATTITVNVWDATTGETPMQVSEWSDGGAAAFSAFYFV